MARYRDPLLWAVHDLHSRLLTITADDFLGRFLVAGDDDMRSYARRHTMFVLAEYLGWVEIVRRSIGFLDLGDHQRNQRLVEHLSTIRRVLFAVDLSPVFHVPNGYQRAIGELMIIQDPTPEGRGWRCIGFAELCVRLDSDESFAEWFKSLDSSIVEYANHPETGHDRLLELDHQLTDLIDFLDPTKVRFPLRHQERSRYLPTQRGEAPAGQRPLRKFPWPPHAPRRQRVD